MKYIKKYKFSLIILIIILWIVWTNFTIVVTDIAINNEKIPIEFNGFRIAHVSDLHNHNWRGRLINKLENEKPDIIAVTGDLVDSNNPDINLAMNFIDRAVKIAPVYYVTGNHEAWLSSYSELESKLVYAGVNMIDDKFGFIKRQDAKIQIIGLKDPDFISKEKLYDLRELTVEKKLERLINKEYYSITLSHRAEIFERYVNVGADLVLAGHAHGGQFRIPIVGGVIAPDQGFLPKYTSGVYHKNSTDMIVSRGLGNSIIPIRVNNTPELIMITLTNNK